MYPKKGEYIVKALESEKRRLGEIKSYIQLKCIVLKAANS